MEQRKAIFLHSTMQPRDRDEARRFADALKTWQACFNRGLAVDCPVSGEYWRNIQCGDHHVLFLKDILDYGCAIATENDVVVFANNDACFTRSGLWKIMALALTTGVATAARSSFPYVSGQMYDRIPLRLDGGIDVIAMTRTWWFKHRDKMPDFVVGREGWDSVFAEIAKRTTSNQAGVVGAVYHRPHKSFWKQNLLTDPGQVYNRRLVEEFQKSS